MLDLNAKMRLMQRAYNLGYYNAKVAEPNEIIVVPNVYEIDVAFAFITGVMQHNCDKYRGNCHFIDDQEGNA